MNGKMKCLFKALLLAAILAPASTLTAQPRQQRAAIARPVSADVEFAPFRDPGPDILLKTNLAVLGVGVANIGAEFRLDPYLSLDIPFIYSPYTWSRTWNLRILAIQPELRVWLKQPLQGHFFGLHIHTAFYSAAVDRQTRYQDRDGDSPLWGVGISYGYSLPLPHRLGLEFNIGAGYANIRYDAFCNVRNGGRYDTATRHYWGITRVGVSLYYSFNLRKR